MKALFLLLIVLAAGGSYYEWNLQQQQTGDFKRQRDELTGRLGQLIEENKKLQDEKDATAQRLAATQSQMFGASSPPPESAVAPATNAAPAGTNAAPPRAP